MQGMAVDKADRLKSVNALSKLLYDEVELENNLLQQKTGRAYVWTRIGHTRTMRREIANVFNTSRKNSRHNIRRMIWIMPCAIVVVIGALGLFHRVYPMQTGSAPDAAFRQVIRTVSDQERGATAIPSAMPSALPNKKSVPPTGVKNTSESTIAVEADKDAKASEAPQNGKDAKASKRSQADKKGGDVNHIKNVLRLEVGDWIVACDGNGTDYVSRIQSICSDEVVASIEKVQPTGTELPVRITLFQGMPKKDKLELIIQKAVELGACEIVPVMTKRTVVKLSEEKKINKRLERWQSIAYAAAKQCDRGIIPTVHKPVSYEEALAIAVR